jgi:hypothetical protein
MCIQQALQRKMLLDMSATTCTGEINQVIDQGSCMGALTGFNEKSRFAMPNNFFYGPSTKGNDWRSGGHSLYGNQPEWFIPFDRKEQAARLSHDLPQGRTL